MKKKLQLTETELIDFIEQTVKRIKKERQSDTIKLNENDLYKIVDKVTAENKTQKPKVTESKKENTVNVVKKEDFKRIRESRKARKVFEKSNNGNRKKITK